ncbi:EpsI family protein [Niveibacterium sp. 24ML]|uniref:exosortase-associated protein EpsI, B-type n=1 Tax=Niveibacterium sp. 24ML TaxID=2985512 RepID=UPI002271B4D6|nr:exosortase-associated protein EpsI, B-type [Niveibacterium sp. 24ML]MCX9156658.1 EpsI family protein [Niveibacterium sp. 24ML]
MSSLNARTNLLRAALVAVLLSGSAGLAVAMKPSRYMAQENAAVEYARLIPTQFGEWREDSAVATSVVNPQQKALLDTLYSQLVSRVYVNKEGRRIMLSLAYGGDQSRDTQVHKPEVCYPAQGFELLGQKKVEIKTPYGSIPSMRLLTRLGARVEPVTYWIRVGDSIVRGSLEQNAARLKFGMKGVVPDGLLIRISEISTDSDSSYRLQDQFVSEFVSNVDSKFRNLIVGKPDSLSVGSN